MLILSFLDSKVVRQSGVSQAVLLNKRGCLRALPGEERRREKGYVSNLWLEVGTFFFAIVGTGLKRLRDLDSPFAGRMTIRVALFCRLFRYLLRLILVSSPNVLF